ncbi:MAG: hypothetical protein IT164_06270 [Bryobacterales bacterium]|nr:hypothetical protein [Bryobacterales bacterium]
MFWIITAMLILLWMLATVATAWEGIAMHVVLFAALGATLAGIIHVRRAV